MRPINERQIDRMLDRAVTATGIAIAIGFLVVIASLVLGIEL
jgi:hypothetical protein